MAKWGIFNNNQLYMDNSRWVMDNSQWDMDNNRWGMGSKMLGMDNKWDMGRCNRDSNNKDIIKVIF